MTGGPPTDPVLLECGLCHDGLTDTPQATELAEVGHGGLTHEQDFSRFCRLVFRLHERRGNDVRLRVDNQLEKVRVDEKRRTGGDGCGAVFDIGGLLVQIQVAPRSFTLSKPMSAIFVLVYLTLTSMAFS